MKGDYFFMLRKLHFFNIFSEKPKLKHYNFQSVSLLIAILAMIQS